jgi:hypothetical protein
VNTVINYYIPYKAWNFWMAEFQAKHCSMELLRALSRDN